MRARTVRESGRKTGGIIALIDQPDNSISICVIQMVFNFPQRYLFIPRFTFHSFGIVSPAATPFFHPSPPPAARARASSLFDLAFLFFFF